MFQLLIRCRKMTAEKVCFQPRRKYLKKKSLLLSVEISSMVYCLLLTIFAIKEK